MKLETSTVRLRLYQLPLIDELRRIAADDGPRLGIDPNTFRSRVHAGWPEEKLFAPNIRKALSERKRLKKLTPHKRQRQFREGMKHLAEILLDLNGT